MFNEQQQQLSPQERQIRYALSMRIATVVVVFFLGAWCLLQWTLQSEQQYLLEGLRRQFVQVEALACAVIAACALLHLLASAACWLAIAERTSRSSTSRAAERHGLPTCERLYHRLLHAAHIE